MITVRKSSDRGTFDHGWLQSAHTFSFGKYHDPDHMGFRTLRVINDDIIAPATGFATHPHRDMEIITYVLDGAIRHGDSLGNTEDITPGMVQVMSAGSGIRHSEKNPSTKVPTRMLQIWIEPDAAGHEPRHESRSTRVHDEPNRLHAIASNDGRDGSATIHQDATIHAATLEPGKSLTVAIDPDRHIWIQVARGSMAVNGTRLSEGDGASVTGEQTLEMTVNADADQNAEFLVFDLS